MWRLVASVLFCWDPDLWGPWGPCAAWVPKGPQRKIVCPTPGQITSSCPPTTTTTALERRKKEWNPFFLLPLTNYSLSSSTTWRANKWKNSAIWNWGAYNGWTVQNFFVFIQILMTLTKLGGIVCRVVHSTDCRGGWPIIFFSDFLSRFQPTVCILPENGQKSSNNMIYLGMTKIIAFASCIIKQLLSNS